MTSTPVTLYDALAAIAARSFYEDAIITPVPGGYAVESAHVLDEVSYPWTREGGTELGFQALDISRLHADYESYDASAHISANLPAAAKALRAGRTVGFGYAIAEEECDSEDAPGAHENSRCLNCDGGGTITAGWHLIATDETM